MSNQENEHLGIPSENTEFIIFIIDNKVQMTMMTDEKMSSIFRSHPVVIRANDRLNADQIQIGCDYDPITGQITPPQPYPSWTMDEETHRWIPPKPKPESAGYWVWSEDEQEWVKIEIK